MSIYVNQTDNCMHDLIVGARNGHSSGLAKEKETDTFIILIFKIENLLMITGSDFLLETIR